MCLLLPNLLSTSAMSVAGCKPLIPIPVMRTVDFANSVDPDEVAHNELPHLDLPNLPSSL